MSVIQITFFTIIISAVLLHTHLADDTPSAVMPQTVTALTGSCVQIPCTFNIPDFEDKRKRAESIYGIWLKNKPNFIHTDSFIAYNSSKNIIRGFSYIQMTGNLTERNCTTVFYNITMNHSDLYYFRLEMEPNVFKATFNPNTAVSHDSSKTVRIAVRDSPQPPELKLNDLHYVLEESTVNLSCSAEAPCPKQPPKISWSNIPEYANITTWLQEKPDKTQLVFLHVTFKASYIDHRKNISCTATYPRNISNNSTVVTTMILRVLFSPKETHITIDPSDSVSVGTNVTLTCKSKASPNEMNYTWYKRGQEKVLDFGEQLTFNVDSRSEGLYFCTAENIHGTQTSEGIQLIVAGSASLESLIIKKSLIIGCVGGISAFLLIFLLVTIFLRVKAFIIRETDVSDQGQEKHVQVNHIYANSAFLMGEKLEMPKDENDIIHYGEIDFSTAQTKSTTEKISGQQTIYAEVYVSGKD